jgi:hypothetical protein
METLVFLTDSLALVLLVLFSLHEGKRKPGEPMAGPFRYSETKVSEGTRAVPLYLQNRTPLPDDLVARPTRQDRG